MPPFQLYQQDYCPHCIRVRKVINRLGIEEGKDYILKEARYGTKEQEELIKIGGKRQVPFLWDEDVQMYESKDIIQYLIQKYSIVL